MCQHDLTVSQCRRFAFALAVKAYLLHCVATAYFLSEECADSQKEYKFELVNIQYVILVALFRADNKIFQNHRFSRIFVSSLLLKQANNYFFDSQAV